MDKITAVFSQWKVEMHIWIWKYLQQTHGSSPCGSRPHSRLCSCINITLTETTSAAGVPPHHPRMLSSQPAGFLLLPVSPSPQSLITGPLHLHSSITAQLGMYFVILLIITSHDCSRRVRGNKVEPEQKLFFFLFCFFPGGDVPCYHNQPCSCSDASGRSDPCPAFYPCLSANHNPDQHQNPISQV